jgi:hypothetical protein
VRPQRVSERLVSTWRRLGCQLANSYPPLIGSCLACRMSLPPVLERYVVRTENALEGVIGAVRAARYDRLADERDPDSGLSVEQARQGIDEAMRNWAAVHEDFVAALDATMKDQPAFESEIISALGALSLLDTGVATEIALAQRLDALDGKLKLAKVPDWPTDGAARLEAAAFGIGVRRLQRLPPGAMRGSADAPQTGLRFHPCHRQCDARRCRGTHLATRVLHFADTYANSMRPGCMAFVVAHSFCGRIW